VDDLPCREDDPDPIPYQCVLNDLGGIVIFPDEYMVDQLEEGDLTCPP